MKKGLLNPACYLQIGGARKGGGGQHTGGNSIKRMPGRIGIGILVTHDSYSGAVRRSMLDKPTAYVNPAECLAFQEVEERD